jgi:hypothetical protein
MAWTQQFSWQKTFKKIDEEIGFKGKLSCLRKTTQNPKRKQKCFEAGSEMNVNCDKQIQE